MNAVWDKNEVTDDGTAYLIEEHATQFEEIDYWVDVAKGIQERYGLLAPNAPSIVLFGEISGLNLCCP